MPPEHASTTAVAEPEFWQSVDQWMDTPQFREMVQNEFPEDAAEWVDPVSRRQFLTLMGASVALAGAAGCNPSLKPASQRKAIPYVHQPDQILPGVPLFFATAMPQAGGLGLGLLVKSVEGRPIKCEGNPNHPSSRGGIDLQALAAGLGQVRTEQVLMDVPKVRVALLQSRPYVGWRKQALLRARMAQQGVCQQEQDAADWHVQLVKVQEFEELPEAGPEGRM